MVSGSDQHGTPVTIRAEAEGKTPAEVAEFYHRTFVEDFEKLGISWDLFTTTRTANHQKIAQDMFLRLRAASDLEADAARAAQPAASGCVG